MVLRNERKPFRMSRHTSIFPHIFADAPKSAAQISALMALSPFVIGTRMMQFWMTAAAPTDASRNEASRMVSEKLEAAGESLVAMNVATIEAMTGAAFAAAAGRTRHVNDGDSILAAGLKPYASRVRANRKRLST